ncbi:MAG TPA: hypothetical protein VN180_04225 [Acidimicrobiia bacterium]|nr:hypothetical protein [Acidimicrobiia bacterium]
MPLAPTPPAAPSASKVMHVAALGTVTVKEPAVGNDSVGRLTV